MHAGYGFKDCVFNYKKEAVALNPTLQWYQCLQTGIYEVQLSNTAGARLNSTVVNNTQLALSLSAGGYPAIDADWSASAMASEAASRWEGGVDVCRSVDCVGCTAVTLLLMPP